MADILAIDRAVEEVAAGVTIEKRGRLTRALLASHEPALLARHFELLTVRPDARLVRQLRVLFWERGVAAIPFLLERAGALVTAVERIEVMSLLALHAHAAALPIARAGVGAPEADLRLRAARVLGWLGAGEDSPALASLLRDPDPQVREMARRAQAHLEARSRGERPLPHLAFCRACLGPHEQLGVITTGRKFVPDDAPPERQIPPPPRLRPARALKCTGCGSLTVLAQPEFTDGGGGSFSPIWTPVDCAAIERALSGIAAGTLDAEPLRVWFHGDYGISGPPKDLLIYGTGDVQPPAGRRGAPLVTRFVGPEVVERVAAFLVQSEAWRSRATRPADDPPIPDSGHVHLEITFNDDATRIEAPGSDHEGAAAITAIGQALVELVG